MSRMMFQILNWKDLEWPDDKHVRDFECAPKDIRKLLICKTFEADIKNARGRYLVQYMSCHLVVPVQSWSDRV